MQMNFKYGTAIAIGMSLCGCLFNSCGTYVTPDESILETKDYRLITRKIGETDSEVSLEDTLGDSSKTIRIDSQLDGNPLKNPLEGILLSLFKEKTDVGGTTVLGHAIPKDKDPLELTGFKKKTVSYEKILESIALKERLITVKYDLSYLYAGTLADKNKKEKGKYIQNLAFKPVLVKEAITHSIQISGSSLLPRNLGTKDDPLAELDSTVSFQVTAYKLSTCTITDEYTVNGKSGNLTAQTKPLSDCL